MTPQQFYISITGINPVPWKEPERGRGITFKNETLRSYQAALASTVKDALVEQGYPLPLFPKGSQLKVNLFVWRQLEKYDINGKVRTGNRADATNIQKATEDALEKMPGRRGPSNPPILFDNDRDNRFVSTYIVEQGPYVESRLVIVVNVLTAAALRELETHAWSWVTDPSKEVELHVG